jgi:signal transduction histidine kinase/CheY-like chemotaxis protein
VGRVLRGFAKVTRDLTERRRAEQELLAARADLERRVTERTEELTQTNAALRSEIRRRVALEDELRHVTAELRRRVAELSEADRQKNEYLAMLAHELRNPLAPIANGLQLLAVAQGQATSAPTVAMMERQLRILVRLVDDLLDLSRIMQKRIELRRRPVEVGDVVRAALETAGPVIAAHGQEVVATIGAARVAVDGDAVRLAQVLANLLVNAAKYSERPGRIEIDAQQAGGWVAIAVRDQGIGIDPGFLPHVFDLFSQADRSLDRSRGGLGVGLTLARRLVELHGGTIEASSAGLGRGSVFVVRLPVLAGESAPRPSTRERLAAVEVAPSRRILVVDDAVDAAESTAALARIWGHETMVLHHGGEVLDAVRQFRPDAVLLDIGLPGADGYEIARQIRRLEGGGALKLLALTGYGRHEDRRQTRAAGFDHHLVKPIDADLLRGLLAF